MAISGRMFVGMRDLLAPGQPKPGLPGASDLHRLSPTPARAPRRIAAMKRRHLLATTGLLAAPALAQRSARAAVRAAGQPVLAGPDLDHRDGHTNHAYYVYDVLYALDGKLQPRRRWRRGTRCPTTAGHGRSACARGSRSMTATPVRSRDCAASIARWAKRDAFGQLVDKVLDRFDTPDDRTLIIRTNRPFPLLLQAISKPDANVAWIMPERLATTDAMKPVTEVVGSGPYRFVADE